MERESFSYLISNPHDLSPPDVSYLEAVVRQFPFCGLAYSLLAKGYASTGNETEPATQALRKAAAYALSRNALRKLLSGEFPATRPTYSTDALEGRLPEPTYPRKYPKEAPEPPEPAPRAEQPLRGFGLDYSDVLFNEEGKKSASPAEEAEKPLAVVARLQQEQLNIIDRFIAAEPRLGPLRATPGKSDEEPEDLLQKRQPNAATGPVTESFAQILVRQGKVGQAIEVYEKLCLKKPEKTAYFAQKIDELKAQLS
jgi:hypothetical protein